MNIRNVIQSVATPDDLDRLKRLPCAEDFYGTIVRMIPFGPEEEFSVADLGAGTGFLAAIIHDQFPKAHITLIDAEGTRSEKSRERFAHVNDQMAWLHTDYARNDPPGKYNLIVSALSVHHLNDIDKRALYRTLYSRVLPGGVFINADRVRPPTEKLQDIYRHQWAEESREAGADEAAISASLDRMADDHDSEAEDQLDWIRNAGFRNVDVWYKNRIFAVFGGQRPDF